MTKVFSMFSGIGGFELGLLMSEKKVKLVGYSEIDKYAIEVFEKQFKGIKNYGNATTIDETKLPNFDLLVGGFPCQAFSVAGNQRGFNDTRGTLFFDVARILNHKKPKHFILENVRGLLSHDSGRTFQTILKVLTDIGYMVQWEVCNSKNYGVPQNRERVYIIGHLRGSSRPKIFPIGKVGKENNAKVKRLGHSNKFRRYNQVFDENGLTEAIDTSGGGGHQPCIIAKPKELTKNMSMAYRVYDADGVSTTLRAVGGGVGAKTGLYQIPGASIRRLTPTECERLQGFPDGWTGGLSDTQRYKCLGNAVTTNVVCEIAKRLLK